MPRLLSSLTAAAAVLADQAADRLDTWVQNTTGAADETPRETPLGFHVTAPDQPDAEVQHLNDALHVANSNNHAMRQELQRTRALLEAAQHDGSTSHLEVSAVMGAYERGTAPNDIQAREDSLAERVLIALVCERGRAADLEDKLGIRGAALDNITANLREYGITVQDPDDLALIVSAIDGVVKDRADALQQLHTIDSALTMYDGGRDPMTMALKHPADTAARVAAALSLAGRKLDAHHRHDEATDER